MALTQWQLKPVATDTIASGDFLAFTDEDESGDPINKLTVDNLMETGLPLVTEDTIAVATDYILFLDGGSTGNTNKEQFSEVMALIAGTSLSASSGVLNVDAASTTAAGSVELATTAELDAGTDTSRAVTPDVLAASVFGERVIQFVVVAPATDVATGDDQAHFLVPSTLNGFDVVEVHAEFITAGVTGANTIMIRNDTAGANILSTGIDIDTGETGSDTGGGYTIDTAQDDLTTNDLIAIDVDLVSTGTAPKGLIVTMVCRKP